MLSSFHKGDFHMKQVFLQSGTLSQLRSVIKGSFTTKIFLVEFLEFNFLWWQPLSLLCLREFHSIPIISLWLTQSWYSSFILYRLRKPCFRWAISPWRPCSKTCGQGLQHRSVRCMGQTGDGSIVERPNNLCPRDKPSGVQNCIRKACYLNWIVGPWSRVSSRDIGKTCQWYHNCWGVL